MRKTVYWLIGFVIVFAVGMYGGKSLAAGTVNRTVNRTITVDRLFDRDDPVSDGETFATNMIISTDGIGYSVSVRTVFMGFEVGETYCAKVRLTYDMGPYILQSFGLGECE
jgi:hypothetical protein